MKGRRRLTVFIGMILIDYTIAYLLGYGLESFTIFVILSHLASAQFADMVYKGKILGDKK